MHVVILDGPCGPFIEQLFSTPFASQQTQIECTTNHYREVTFPSAECSLLPPEIKIILETSDLSHASFALLSRVPHLFIATDSEMSSSRLIVVRKTTPSLPFPNLLSFNRVFIIL